MFIEIPVQKEWNLTSLQYAVIPSIAGATSILGGFFYGFMSDNYGRVWPYALAAVNIAVFSLASAFSPGFATMIALKAVTNFAITGSLSMVYPTLAEFLPVRKRGKVLALVFLIQAIGNCATAGLAWWLIPTFTQRGCDT